MTYNLLHLARAQDFFLARPEQQNPLIDDSLLAIAALSQMDAGVGAELCHQLFSGEQDIGGRKISELLADFFMHASGELARYSGEIQRRVRHATEIGIYEPDTPEQAAAKQAENADICPGNHYFAGYLLLCKNGINYSDLSIYEALLAIDEITCNEVNAGSHQLISMLASERPADEQRFKQYLKHANFIAISLDIYNELDKLWTQVRNSKDMK